MKSSRNICIRLLLIALFVLASSATSAEEEDITEFEGWEATEKKKEKEEEEKAPTPAETEAAPAPAPAPVPEPVTELREKTPGSHTGLLPSVHHQYGSLALMGIFQTLFDTAFILDDNEDTESVAFTFQRARIMLKGHLITENLTYFFQGDAGNMASFVLDMFLNYKFSDTGLSLKIGRFLPDFSYMMPRNKADIAAIMFPEYLTYAGFAPWRQIGLEASYQANQQLTFKLGVFNGFMYDPVFVNPALINMQMGIIDVAGTTYSNYTDNNKAKDFMLRASYQVNPHFSFDLNFWFGMPLSFADPDENDLLIMGGPGVEYNNGKLHLITEFMFRVVSFGQDGADPSSRTSLGLWAHAGYRLTDLIEAIFRIDWVEPDLDDAADNDMRMRITIGPHFWIEEKHFRILVNLFFDIPLEGDPPSGEEIIGFLTQFAILF
jgi:hypothetical protein